MLYLLLAKISSSNLPVTLTEPFSTTFVPLVDFNPDIKIYFVGEFLDLVFTH